MGCCGYNKDGSKCRRPIQRGNTFACKKHWAMVPWATREDYRDAVDMIYTSITGCISTRFMRKGTGLIGFYTKITGAKE